MREPTLGLCGEPGRLCRIVYVLVEVNALTNSVTNPGGILLWQDISDRACFESF
jgi:hypothetical protein